MSLSLSPSASVSASLSPSTSVSPSPSQVVYGKEDDITAVKQADTITIKEEPATEIIAIEKEDTLNITTPAGDTDVTVITP